MNDTKIDVQSQKPAVVSYDSFDVMNGKGGLERSAYKAASFHNSGDTSDARFVDKASLLGSSAGEIMGEAVAMSTPTEKKEVSNIQG